jgi:hypothetical protein
VVRVHRGHIYSERYGWRYPGADVTNAWHRRRRRRRGRPSTGCLACIGVGFPPPGCDETVRTKVLRRRDRSLPVRRRHPASRRGSCVSTRDRARAGVDGRGCTGEKPSRSSADARRVDGMPGSAHWYPDAQGTALPTRCVAGRTETWRAGRWNRPGPGAPCTGIVVYFQSMTLIAHWLAASLGCATALDPARTPVSRIAVFTDPDGNGVGVVQPPSATTIPEHPGAESSPG